MITFIMEEGTPVIVPADMPDIHAFRRWTDSEDYPENAKTWWLRGEVWVDMSKEQLFTHLTVKGEFYLVLGGLVRESASGWLFPDGLLITNFTADISGNPDATYVSRDSVHSEAVRLIEGKGKHGGYVEIQGSPDMVLEVVSESSVHKDTELLREGYWEAGVREYWLVDAREQPISFDILRHTVRGFVATRKQDGWIKSSVFGKSFRLIQGIDDLQLPTFTLEVR